jgi:hypothetical protein
MLTVRLWLVVVAVEVAKLFQPSIYPLIRPSQSAVVVLLVLLLVLEVLVVLQ